MKREDLLANKRNNSVNTYLHRASRKIVDTLAAWQCGTVVIGYNEGWKQEYNLGKRNTQSFVQIPFDTLVKMIAYKAETVGIKVVMTEESYTSKASFFNRDALPVYDGNNTGAPHAFTGKRVKRGLYINEDGTKINADVNGALNIIRKVFPNVQTNGIAGYTSPTRVAI